ncbi:MAG TPA: response regulator transcription factor [Gemmatimonadaceae bacterium]|nr:response regulator transcription factor [Gemmatimonadaceae bacterium]
MTSSTPRATTVLLVEDKRELRDVLRRSFAEHGFAVLTAGDGPAGVEAALERRPDVIVLDIGLPGQNGLDVARTLRERGSRVPILMLTAHSAVPDRLAGFDAGADDYLGKPFNFGELLARVHALLRRSRSDANVIRYADVACDPLTRKATRGGRPLALTQREYALLEYLLRHAGHPVTREQIARDVWHTSFDPEHTSIEVYVSYLRNKLNAAGGPPLLHTVRKVGYVLKDGEE